MNHDSYMCSLDLDAAVILGARWKSTLAVTGRAQTKIPHTHSALDFEVRAPPRAQTRAAPPPFRANRFSTGLLTAIARNVDLHPRFCAQPTRN